MSPDHASPAGSKKLLWTGWVMSALPALFLLVDGAMKLVKPEPVVTATLELGYPESAIVGIGIALLASTILYLVPPTAVLGAILLTGYLGGGGDACARRPWTVRDRFPGHFRRAALGRAVGAG
jgi:hypothetical protein